MWRIQRKFETRTTEAENQIQSHLITAELRPVATTLPALPQPWLNHSYTSASLSYFLYLTFGDYTKHSVDGDGLLSHQSLVVRVALGLWSATSRWPRKHPHRPVPPPPNSSAETSIQCDKPLWNDVAGFMWASSSFHRMGFRRWLQVTSVKSINDWSVITDNIELIREIHCLDGTLLDPKHQNTLSKIPHLYAAIIDAHSDVWHDEHNRFAYRDVLSALPPSLKRLEIKHAHGPDIKVISLVKKDCPELEELVLGRCTMFNRSPACDFWVSFPHDHDAYMSNTGTDAYAHSLANELAPLKYLQSLRVGLYFVPSDIVLAHRLYHRRGLPAPGTIDWQSAIPLAELPTNADPQELPPHVDLATSTQLVSLLHRRDADAHVEFKCWRCTEITGVTGREAETSASSILRSYLPRLTSVEWMGWLTPQHLGIHSYRFSPSNH